MTAAPEHGRANDEVISLLAEALDISRTSVRLVAGKSSRDKIVELDGIAAAEAERRLQHIASSPIQDVAGVDLS